MIWEILFGTAGFIALILSVGYFFYLLRKQDQQGKNK